MAVIPLDTKYTGVDVYTLVGESFIAYSNRDIESPNVLAFELVLHTISLTVGYCVKNYCLSGSSI